jgi:3D (Asp-Asp-Asp) domain-containing protein
MPVRRLALVAGLAATTACGQAAPPQAEVLSPALHIERNPEPADPTAVDWEGLSRIPATTTTALDQQRVTSRRSSRGAASRTGIPAARAGAATPDGDERVVTSTAYCLTGRTASGAPARAGMAAMNGVPLGSRWQVDGGGVFVIADRIGHGSQFDIAMPGDCDAARRYGRRTITVRRVA